MRHRPSQFAVDWDMSWAIDRRMALTLALTGLSSRALALDRPIASTTVVSNRVSLSCDNTSVAFSDVAGRLAAVSDFNFAGRCVMLENSIEGPYFTCVSAVNGKNIIGRLSGQPLTVALRVLDTNCNPVPGAVVDVWSCGPDGRYSGYDVSPDIRVVPGGGSRHEPTNAERFARGVLRTDAEGIVEFDTIYPGFYAGRSVHIHFKVHVGNKAYLTHQAHLPEEVNERIMRLTPYNAPRPIKRVLNMEDTRLGIFPTFKVIDRGSHLLAVLNVGLPPG